MLKDAKAFSISSSNHLVLQLFSFNFYFTLLSPAFPSSNFFLNVLAIFDVLDAYDAFFVPTPPTSLNRLFSIILLLIIIAIFIISIIVVIAMVVLSSYDFLINSFSLFSNLLPTGGSYYQFYFPSFLNDYFFPYSLFI